MADVEEAGEEKRHHRACCCISHEFTKAASENPTKIAVIHASGGARLCRQFRANDPNFNNSDHNLFHSHRISPSKPALQGDQCFTFSQLLASVQSLSCRIHRVLSGGDDPNLIRTPTVYGIGNEIPVVVGIYMAPSVEYIVSVLSVLRCEEAVFLPLDPSWPKQRVLSIIAASKLSLILTAKTSSIQSCIHQLEESESGCAVLEMSMSDNSNLDCSRSLDLVRPCQSTRTRKFCYVMYTSGSTGKPKGVCGTELECDAANAPLKNHRASSLENFCDLPAKTRRQICYVHPSIICDVFPTGIELLGTQSPKGVLDNLVSHTREALAKIRAEQRRRLEEKTQMASQGLLVLSDPSEDTVDGAEEFEVGSLDKGMRKGDLPGDVEEDANSGYQPSSGGLMVKEISRRPGSRASSKEPVKGAAVEAEHSRKSKRKTDTGNPKETVDGRGKKKKKRAKTAQETETELAEQTDVGQTDVAGEKNEDVDQAHIDLSAEGDEPPPRPAHPFMPQPRLQGGHITVKENDRGLGHPSVASALMDSILLPGDVDGYLQHSERALMNRLTELTYEANVIRAASAKKQELHGNRLASCEERLKNLEDAGRHASRALEKQLQGIDSLKLANQKLRSDLGDLTAKLTTEEGAKAALDAERTALLADKAKVEASLNELKQNFVLERDTLQKEKADLTEALHAAKADSIKVEDACKRN